MGSILLVGDTAGRERPRTRQRVAVERDKWFKLDLLCHDQSIVVKINDNLIVDGTSGDIIKPGPIQFKNWWNNGEVSIKNIEIQELTSSQTEVTPEAKAFKSFDVSSLDELLVIETNSYMDNPGAYARVRERLADFEIVNRTDSVARLNDLNSQHKNVYLMHSLGRDAAGSVDFSRITNNAKGLLKIYYRNLLPQNPLESSHKFVVKKNGEEVVTKDVIHVLSWESVEINFDNESIRLEHWPIGFEYEYGLYDFVFRFD